MEGGGGGGGQGEKSGGGGREGGGVEERNQPTVTLAEAYHNTISHLLQYLPCQSLKGLEGGEGGGGGGGEGGEVRMKCSGTPTQSNDPLTCRSVHVTLPPTHVTYSVIVRGIFVHTAHYE